MKEPQYILHQPNLVDKQSNEIESYVIRIYLIWPSSVISNGRGLSENPYFKWLVQVIKH